MKQFSGYILDLDGTVYLGERAIPGAASTVSALRKNGSRIVFLTNKPLYQREDYAHKLSAMGIPAAVDDIINSSWVMANYLKEVSPGCSAYVIGEPPLCRELARAGIRVVDNPSITGYRVDYVIASFDRTFDYAKLNNALQAIRNGARLIATNRDKTCPVESGEIPDAAGVVGAIEGITGMKPEFIAGKPSDMVVRTALKVMGHQAADCLIAGDRLETDILMGRNAGVKTALVLTGITKREHLKESEIRPDYILESITDLADE